MRSGIGAPLPRKEDFRLLTGRGCYSDDFSLPGQAYATLVRSPHAHARIRSIAADDALAMPGVLAVLTGADYVADGLAAIPLTPHSTSPPDIRLANADGSPIFLTSQFPMPADKVRFVGEAVTMVIGETIAAAKDGAEAVRVEYEPLTPVTAGAAAASGNAPLVWDERSNTVIDAQIGDAAAAMAAFSRAAHRVRFSTWVQRVAAAPMEPRAALGAYDAAGGRYTLFAGGGGIVRPKRELARILGVADDRVRVLAREVGGNFGPRNYFYPEFALVVWAARRIGRPIKWTGDRQEGFLTDYQARDLLVEAELALDADGRFLALRASNLGNVGAHTLSFVPLTKGSELMSSTYRIPAAQVRARAVLSNTPPTAPYRSAGRPEVMFVIERLIDRAAHEHGFDRVALRRRNLIPEAAMPYANPLGMTYDSGAYERVMDRALALADWAGFPVRRADALRRGRRRGIGLGTYIESASGAPNERAEITVRPEGRVEVVIGTLSSGQGHETSFAQLLTEWLGVLPEQVELITSDTDIVAVGGGSHSGRSMRLAGIVMYTASREIVAKGLRVAAHLLETAEADIEFADGRFIVKGTDRSLDLFAVAAAALECHDLPEALRGALAGAGDVVSRVSAFPYGWHVCEVEIDPDTGLAEIARYTAVDDVGRAVNPLIVDGQTHGGIAQGIGQALMEQCVYDATTGQLLSGSFMDYAVPRAADLPLFATAISEVPSTTHPLGFRAGGEGGITPAPAVVINAVVDALSDLGVRHVEMPATAERIWRAIRSARR